MTRRASPTQYVSQSILAAWLGVKPQTAGVIMIRREDFPAPDALFESTRSPFRGYLPSREAEIREWNAQRMAVHGHRREGHDHEPPSPDAAGPVRYWLISKIGVELGVSRHTSACWTTRYHNVPVPDALLMPGRNGHGEPAWLPSRLPEWRAWMTEGRPGQGAAGQPKPRRVGT